MSSDKALPLVTLEAPTAEDCERVRRWRNRDLTGLRTGYPLTQEMQADFYQRVICNRDAQATMRYWSVYGPIPPYLPSVDPAYAASPVAPFVAFAGLIHIEPQHRRAEISLVTNPDRRGRGYGAAAVDALLREGFDRLNLRAIYGDCYACNPAIGFWTKLCLTHGADMVWLPAEVFWEGRYWRTLRFTFWNPKEHD